MVRYLQMFSETQREDLKLLKEINAEETSLRYIINWVLSGFNNYMSPFYKEIDTS